jgi:alcohol dehydrogenase class IV
VFGANAAALAARAPQSPALARMGEVAAILTGRPQATPQEGAEWLRELCADLQIPRLAQYGFGMGDAPALIAKAQAASSMKANPLPLTDEELHAILLEAT